MHAPGVADDELGRFFDENARTAVRPGLVMAVDQLLKDEMAVRSIVEVGDLEYPDKRLDVSVEVSGNQEVAARRQRDETAPALRQIKLNARRSAKGAECLIRSIQGDP
jgi:hypothetical protein